MKVTALLVSHDGSRWLRQVLPALEASTRQPDRFVAVDTGSTDGSAALLEGAGRRVITAAAETGFGDAVREGLAACAPDPAAADEWIWLLHDDAAPAADCLARLVEAAAAGGPDLAAVGPKLREWPSLRRLLEVGVTVSRGGRRETGLETGEYDQGQHDEQRRVLAVNTAGMLIRRTVLEEVGFDRALPVFGADLDLGWRLARRGQQVHVVPAAVLFHAEAARRRVRPGLDRPRRQERAAAVRTALVHASGRSAVWRGFVLLVAGTLRALGLLALRAPHEAADELAALRGVLGHPGAVRAARRLRSQETTAPPDEVRALLAPRWMPWRHALDGVLDLGRALAAVARDAAVRRRDGSERRPREVLTSPVTLGFVALLVISLVASGPLLSGPPLQGGALTPVPDGPGHWWSLWWSSWHWVGEGSSHPAMPALLPLAVLGTLLVGQPALVVWLLFCALPPLAYLGAYRLLARLVTSRWSALWGAAAWALLPVLSGAVGGGRVGTVVTAVLLPWLVAAALRMAAADAEARARAVWRTALLGGLLVLFVPSMLVAFVLLAVAAPLVGARALHPVQRAGLAVVPVLLLSPWLPVLVSEPGAWLLETGRPAASFDRPGWFSVVVGDLGAATGAPPWLLLGLPLAAAVAMLRGDVRAVVQRCWWIAVPVAAMILLHLEVAVSLPGVPVSFHPWPGAWALALLGCWVLACAVAADGLVPLMAGSGFGWRQPVAAVAVLAALLAPVGGAVWWLASGTPGPLHRARPASVPAYLADLAASRHAGATLLLRDTGIGVPGRGVGYAVLRGPGLRLGDDGVLAITPRGSAVPAAVATLLGSGGGGTVSRAAGGTGEGSAARTLADRGIAYVYTPAPVDPAVAGALDASGGFTAASAGDRRSRAWRLVPRANLSALPYRPSPLHPWLLAVQLMALAAGVVLVLPSRRRR